MITRSEIQYTMETGFISSFLLIYFPDGRVRQARATKQLLNLKINRQN